MLFFKPKNQSSMSHKYTTIKVEIPADTKKGSIIRKEYEMPSHIGSVLTGIRTYEVVSAENNSYSIGSKINGETVQEPTFKEDYLRTTEANGEKEMYVENMQKAKIILDIVAEEDFRSSTKLHFVFKTR